LLARQFSPQVAFNACTQEFGVPFNEVQLNGIVVVEVLGVSVSESQSQERHETANGFIRIRRMHNRRHKVFAFEYNGAFLALPHGQAIPDAGA